MPLINLSAVRQGHRRFLQANEKLVARVAAQAGKFAARSQIERAEFRHRTGAIKRGARGKVIRTKRGRVVKIHNVAKHAPFLELGTRPHIIRARRGRYLRFFWLKRSKMMFLRSVRHPGTKPYRFIRNAANHTTQYARQQLERGMRQIASQF